MKVTAVPHITLSDGNNVAGGVKVSHTRDGMEYSVRGPCGAVVQGFKPVARVSLLLWQHDLVWVWRSGTCLAGTRRRSRPTACRVHCFISRCSVILWSPIPQRLSAPIIRPSPPHAPQVRCTDETFNGSDLKGMYVADGSTCRIAYILSQTRGCATTW